MCRCYSFRINFPAIAIPIQSGPRARSLPLYRSVLEIENPVHPRPPQDSHCSRHIVRSLEISAHLTPRPEFEQRENPPEPNAITRRLVHRFAPNFQETPISFNCVFETMRGRLIFTGRWDESDASIRACMLSRGTAARRRPPCRCKEPIRAKWRANGSDASFTREWQLLYCRSFPRWLYADAMHFFLLALN